MPLFDFTCRTCGETFETLVRHGSEPACAHCGGRDLEKLPSMFAVSSAERSQASAASSRRKQAAEGRQKSIAIEKEMNEHRREEH